MKACNADVGIKTGDSIIDVRFSGPQVESKGVVVDLTGVEVASDGSAVAVLRFFS